MVQRRARPPLAEFRWEWSPTHRRSVRKQAATRSDPGPMQSPRDDRANAKARWDKERSTPNSTPAAKEKAEDWPSAPPPRAHELATIAPPRRAEIRCR